MPHVCLHARNYAEVSYSMKASVYERLTSGYGVVAKFKGVYKS